MPDSNVVRLRPPRPCPICSKPSAQAFHPFCSARCADVDLNRWLTGSYVIPASVDKDAEEGDEGATPSDAPYDNDEDI